MAAAVDAADARTMEKFVHVAEKFVHKSIAAALSPIKDAILQFERLQADTVRTAENGSCWNCRSLALTFV
jgi:hypothetical protein